MKERSPFICLCRVQVPVGTGTWLSFIPLFKESLRIEYPSILKSSEFFLKGLSSKSLGSGPSNALHFIVSYSCDSKSLAGLKRMALLLQQVDSVCHLLSCTVIHCLKLLVQKKPPLAMSSVSTGDLARKAWSTDWSGTLHPVPYKFG